MSKFGRLAALPLAVAVMMATGGAPAHAESEWQPFRTDDTPAKRPRSAPADTAPPLAPMMGSIPPPARAASSTVGTTSTPPGFGVPYPGSESPPAYARPLGGAAPNGGAVSANSKIERLEVEPTPTSDGSGLPQDAWRGMDVKAVEQIVAGLSLPPRSAALFGLWTRLLSASADIPAGGQTPAHFDAIRLEALYRSGLLFSMGERLKKVQADDPIFQAFAIRRDLATGNREAVCQASRGLIAKRNGLPTGLISELHLLTGYCAAAEGNGAAAGLAAELAREDRVDAPVALAALDALAGNGKAGLPAPKVLRVLDYRLLELLGPIDGAQVLEKAEPALAAALALDENTAYPLRAMAAEAAARFSAVSAQQLLTVYSSAPAGADEPVLRRAELVRLISAEPSAGRKLQLSKAALDDARRSGLLLPMARVLAVALSGVQPSPEVLPAGETAIEIFLAAGDVAKARIFAQSPSFRHWLALLDIAERGPSEIQREQNLQALDDFVRRGRFPADLLHRLATVLDATDVNVPIPLWEAASRTPQPSTGYLPDTGVLPQLQEAAKKKEAARTILLTMRAIGPSGADGAHIIGLGDSIRALRRAGFDDDARRLGVEALIAQWPRGSAS